MCSDINKYSEFMKIASEVRNYASIFSEETSLEWEN